MTGQTLDSGSIRTVKDPHLVIQSSDLRDAICQNRMPVFFPLQQLHERLRIHIDECVYHTSHQACESSFRGNKNEYHSVRHKG